MFDEPEPEPSLPSQISIVPDPQPQGTVLPQGLMDQVDKFISNPLFAISAKKYVPEIRKYIKDNSGDYEPLVYDYISSKYPNVSILLNQKPEYEDNEDEDDYEDEDEDDSNVDVRKPVPRSAINYEIYELAKEGYTPTEISDFLNKKYDCDLLPMHVGRAIKRQRQAALTATKLKTALPIKPLTSPSPSPSQVLTTLPQAHDIKLNPKQSNGVNVDSTASSLVFIDTISMILWDKIKIYVFMSASLLAGFIIGRLS